MPQHLTPRQQRFIASLAAERDIDGLIIRRQQQITDAAAGTLSSLEASQLIERLLRAPRRSPGMTHASEGELVDTPSPNLRAGRMLAAGGIEATVTGVTGQHCTVVFRTRGRRGRGWANMAPGEEGSRTSITILGSKVGWVNVDDAGIWTLTLRTRRPEYIAAIKAVLRYAAGFDVKPFRVQEASRCGRCFRTLTDPVSIDRGIGPECFGRDTGSQHVAADREARGEAVTRGEVREQPETLADALTTDALTTPAPTANPTVVANLTVNTENAVERLQRMGRAARNAARAADRLVETTTVEPDPEPVTAQAVEVAAARALIAEALDAYCNDADRDRAMRVFDQLAAR